MPSNLYDAASIAKQFKTIDSHNHQSGHGYYSTTSGQTYTSTNSGWVPANNGTTAPNITIGPHQHTTWPGYAPTWEDPQPQTMEEVQERIEEVMLELERLQAMYDECRRQERGLVLKHCAECDEEYDHDPDDYICLKCREEV